MTFVTKKKEVPGGRAYLLPFCDACSFFRDLQAPWITFLYLPLCSPNAALACHTNNRASILCKQASCPHVPCSLFRRRNAGAKTCSHPAFRPIANHRVHGLPYSLLASLLLFLAAHPAQSHTLTCLQTLSLSNVTVRSLFSLFDHSSPPKASHSSNSVASRTRKHIHFLHTRMEPNCVPNSSTS